MFKVLRHVETFDNTINKRITLENDVKFNATMQLLLADGWKIKRITHAKTRGSPHEPYMIHYYHLIRDRYYNMKKD